jgi:hypothetical protein
MLVRIKPSLYRSGYSKEVQDYLAPGKVVRAYIAEHDKDENEGGWYLVDCGHPQTGVFVSDNGVLSGSIIRTFHDPELPKEYNRGPYTWLGKRDCEEVYENNEGAKFLLQKYEWRV